MIINKQYRLAKIDEDNIVVNAIQCENKFYPNSIGEDDGSWILVDGELPAIGYNYTEGSFKPQQPYPSWVWNVNHWEPPVVYPTSTSTSVWNEQTQTWDLVINDQS